MPNGAPSQAVDAMLREYDVLRAEIALYRQEQNRALIFAMVGTSVLASAFYVVRESPNADFLQRALLLVLSLFVMINGIAFTDRSLRIKRIARYLHSYLRPKLIELLRGRHVWYWELFKGVSYSGANIWRRALTHTLDQFRLAFFWLATLASWFLYARQHIQQMFAGCFFDCTISRHILLISPSDQSFLTSVLGWVLIVLLPELILLVLNFVAFWVFLFASWRIQETKGASSDATLNEDIDWRNKIDWLSARQINDWKTR